MNWHKLLVIMVLFGSLFGLTGLGFTCSDLRGEDAGSQVQPVGTDGANTETEDTGIKDSDGDNLTDTEEQQYGTNHQRSDTDNDGLNDYEEVTGRTDPRDSDTDDDGLNDFEEKEYGTDPENADTDGDTYTDGEEVENGYNPLGDGWLKA